MSAKPALPIKTGHLFIGIALVLAIASAFLFSSLLGSQPEPETVVEVETQPIVLATTPIPAGTVLSKRQLELVEWPIEHYPQGHVFDSTKELVGRTARRDILPGEPLFQEKLAGTSTLGGLTVLIPEGMRALTIKVTDIKGVAGFLKPGDRVDVLANVEITKDSQRVNLTRTMLQNILVLAAEQEMVDERILNAETQGDEDGEGGPRPSHSKSDKKPKPAKNITLAVWPDEAERLVLAEEMGNLRLALRYEADHSIVSRSGVSDEELFGAAASRALGLQDSNQKYDYTVELISGTNKTNVNF